MPIKSKKLLLVRAGARTSVTDVFALRAGELTGATVKICSDVACFIPR